MKKMLHRMLGIGLALWLIPIGVCAEQLLVPVGKVIGLRISGGPVTVAAVEEDQIAAVRKAGLKIGDELLEADGQPVQSSADLRRILSESDGTVALKIRRSGSVHTVNMEPKITEHGPRLGLYLREGISGLGTVTWYDPSSGQFGALGHGINDRYGKLEEMTGGEFYSASVGSVRKGKPGSPGQLRGSLKSNQSCGSIVRNTPQGVFGTALSGWSGEPLPVGQADRIHLGNAVIRATVAGTVPKEYAVKILKIYPDDRDNGRNMLLEITDPGLLSATGGIVQGMPLI